MSKRILFEELVARREQREADREQRKTKKSRKLQLPGIFWR